MLVLSLVRPIFKSSLHSRLLLRLQGSGRFGSAGIMTSEVPSVGITAPPNYALRYPTTIIEQELRSSNRSYHHLKGTLVVPLGSAGIQPSYLDPLRSEALAQVGAQGQWFHPSLEYKLGEAHVYAYVAWTVRVYLESLVGLVLNCSKHKQKDPFKKPAGPRCKAKVRTCYYCCCCVCVCVCVCVCACACAGAGAGAGAAPRHAHSNVWIKRPGS